MVQIAENHYSLPHRQPQRRNSTGLTEIVLPAGDEPDYDIVLPMLAHLSHQSENRWLTWIAPRGITKARLLAFGFNLQRVQVISCNSKRDLPWLLWEALNNGTSATVVADIDGFSEQDMEKLELAASQGQCRALLLRHR